MRPSRDESPTLDECATDGGAVITAIGKYVRVCLNDLHKRTVFSPEQRPRSTMHSSIQRHKRRHQSVDEQHNDTIVSMSIDSAAQSKEKKCAEMR